MTKKQYKHLSSRTHLKSWNEEMMKANSTVYETPLFFGVENVKYKDSLTFFSKRIEVILFEDLSAGDMSDLINICAHFGDKYSFYVNKIKDRSVPRFHFHLTPHTIAIWERLYE